MTILSKSNALRSTAALAAAGASLALLPGASQAKVLDKSVDGAQSFVRYDELPGQPKRYANLSWTMKFETFDASFTKLPLKGAAGVSYGRLPKLTVRDVNADGNRDGIVDVVTKGPGARTISSIALSKSMTQWNKPITVDWGRSGYALQDLGGDKKWEFITADERFKAFAGDEEVPLYPIVIKRGAKHKLIDVSAKYPGRIRKDAVRFQDVVINQAPGVETADPRDKARKASVHAALAALVADLVRLDDIAGAKAVVQQVKDRGDLSVDDASGIGGKLQEWGYLVDPAAVGLGA